MGDAQLGQVYAAQVISDLIAPTKPGRRGILVPPTRQTGEKPSVKDTLTLNFSLVKLIEGQ